MNHFEKRKRKKMIEQLKSNIPTPLQSLGMIFLIFFVLAFECNNDRNRLENNSPPPPQAGGSCSTKAEFLNIFKRDRLKSATTSNDIRQSEIIVTSFNVAAPISYNAVYNNDSLKIYPAYPVTVNWTERTFRHGLINEDDVAGGLFYCHKNPEDNRKFVPEDPRFPENACVCVAMNLEATGSGAKSRSCRYNEDKPDNTCPAN